MQGAQIRERGLHIAQMRSDDLWSLSLLVVFQRCTTLLVRAQRTSASHLDRDYCTSPAGSPSQVSVVCPIVDARGLLIFGNLAAAPPCPSSTSAADTASVTVLTYPVPTISITATNAVLCAADSQATVGFDFSTSQNMAPLTTGQISVQAQTSAGAVATGVSCVPTGLLTVGCVLFVNN